MAYIPTQTDIELLYQNKLDLFIIINLLNKNFQTVETLQGELLDDNYNIEADSDIRRNFDLTMFVKDSSFLIGNNTKIWLNKYIQIYIGVKNQRTEEIIYYNMGMYLFNEIGYEYNTTTKTLSLSCVDLMAKFTGLRGGQVRGLQTIIYSGSDIRKAMIDTITYDDKNFKYRIDNRIKSKTIENIFNKDSGSTEYINTYFQNSIFNRPSLFFSIPSGETTASITYYDVSKFEFGETYTIPFPPTIIAGGSMSTEFYFTITFFGKSNNIDKTQVIVPEYSNPFEITIDKDFTQLKYMKIELILLSPNEDLIKAEMEEFWIFKGSGYKSYNLPAYIAYDATGSVPYDLEFNVGATQYDIIKELNDLESGWEFFIDTDGTFINQKIPTTEQDSCILDWEILNPLIINEHLETNFESVKNSTRIWGKCIEPDRIGIVKTNGTTYSVEIDYLIGSNQPDIDDGLLIALTFPDGKKDDINLIMIVDKYANPQFVDNEIQYDRFIQTCRLSGVSNMGITATDIEAGKTYVFKYSEGTLYLQGQEQVCYVVKEYNELPLAEGQTKEDWIKKDKEIEGTNNVKYIINSESDKITPDMTEAEKREYYNPFAIDEIGEVRNVLGDGDYEKIYTDDLARQRAEYENWKSMRLNTTLTLELKPIFWLDVNQKIQYKSKITGKIEEYIIKSISSSSMSGTMTIEAVKFFPLYPFIVDND